MTQAATHTHGHDHDHKHEDGAFECTTSFDDDGPPTQDTGDVDLQESEENKSFRMGG